MTRKDKSPSRKDRRRSSDDNDAHKRKHKDHKYKEHDRKSPQSRKDNSPSRKLHESTLERSSRKKKSKERQHKNRDHSRDSKRDRSLKRKYHDHSPESSHRKKHRKHERSHSESRKEKSSRKTDNEHSENLKNYSIKQESSDYFQEPQLSIKQENTVKQESYVKTESIKHEETDNSDLLARKRKRESKWSSAQAKVPLYLKPDDAEIYSIQIQINSLTTKLAQQNYTEEIEAMCRLPSPDPIYGHDGKRINTKEYRARERMEERKRNLILRLYALRPDLVPHADKMMGARIEEKVFIPQDDYPDINFAGLIIGPRGMTQKDLEKETGTKILLRGKGSAKPGKLNGGSAPLPGEDEPLHAYITSMSRESVDQAVEKIKKIIQDGIEFPELQNDLRKNQMKQLAILNGTYRETEGLNKLKILNEAQSIATNTIFCSLCGGTGHLPRDCKVNTNEIPMMQYPVQHVQLEGEYNNFINELGIDEATAKPAYLGFVPNQQSSSNPNQGASSFVRNFIFRS